MDSEEATGEMAEVRHPTWALSHLQIYRVLRDDNIVVVLSY